MDAIKEKLKTLPELPGVYIMKNSSGEVIYVGKAKVLKNRVRQYFQSSSSRTPKVKVMVSRIADFEFIITDTELEALVLECNLIKKYKPRYNVLLKDDKNYPYIKVTLNEEYPKIMMTRRLENDNARYFGPFGSSFAVRETIELVQKIFEVATCKRKFPKDIGKERPCLYYSIGRCVAPCTGTISAEDYHKIFEDVCSFLEGKHQQLVDTLTKEMRSAAQKLEFERAADLRDKIESINKVMQKQKMIMPDRKDADIFSLLVEDGLAAIEIFYVRGGKLIGRDSHIFEANDIDEPQIMSDFLSQFYERAVFVPPEVVLSHGIEDADVLEDYLKEKRGGKVRVKCPKRGEYRQIVLMAQKNAKQAIEEYRLKKLHETGKKAVLKELEQKIGVYARRIEAYDVSNISGSENVASMVVFVDGQPKKSEYRRFKIKYVEGANDYDSMREVLLRRFSRAESGDEKFTNLPDLILVDGGRGQLSVAKEVARDIPVFGMVKDDRHRTRDLISTDGEIHLLPASASFKLIERIQDEVHRFAIEYHRKLREKKITASELDGIKGVGAVKKKKLFTHFKSIRKIKEASVDELVASGIDRKTAENIFEFFRK